MVGFGASASDETTGPVGEPFVYTQWETFYAEEGGLPNDHIFAITADGDSLWVGTEDGLALYEKGKWRSWREKDGLPWRVVSAIAVSEKTGDVWVGLFGGGLARYSGGRFDHFNQFNSGLVNDVVYGVAVLDDTVWVATTAGMSALNTVTGEWEIYTEKNAPMEEIWCYSVDAGDGKVYAAVWGGGILEWDVKTRRWNAHRDPDREMEIDLYRDDGLVHVTALKRDYYQFDAAHHRLVGELTGRSYRLGDRLQVQVARVNMEDRKIDFDLVGNADEKEVTKTRRKGKKGKTGHRRKAAGKGKKGSKRS